MTFDQAEEIQQHFIQQYFNPPVNPIGLTRLKIAVEYKNLVLDPPLSSNETLEDWCISVGFEVVPNDLSIYPKVFKGLRVVYEVIGTIQLL